MLEVCQLITDLRRDRTYFNDKIFEGMNRLNT